MEDLPRLFGLSFFFRYLVPALSVSLFSYPLLTLLNPQPILTLKSMGWYALILLFVPGLLLRSLYPLYLDFLEGYTFPQLFRARRIAKLERKLRLREAQMAPDDALSPKDKRWWKRIRAMNFLMCFPIDKDGKRIVLAPTVFGNISLSLGAYMAREFLQQGTDRAIPTRMYIDLAWMTLPAGLRQELQEVSAPSEAAISTTIGLILFTCAYAVTAIARPFWPSAVRYGAPFLLSLAAVCAVFAILAYEVSVAEVQFLSQSYQALIPTLSDSVREQLRQSLNRIREQFASMERIPGSEARIAQTPEGATDGPPESRSVSDVDRGPVASAETLGQLSMKNGQVVDKYL